MDEKMIEITTQDIEVVNSEIIENRVVAEESEQYVETEEVRTSIEVEAAEEVVIEVEEAIGWTSGDFNSHYSLTGRNEPNQHEIKAITGLRSELDEIERLKTVYADKINVANYYKWHDAAHNDFGYFVSIVPNTTTIAVCEGFDIFGVSVDDAGFIGGQDQLMPRDNSYGLIVTSGLVDVRCELGVEVGDCVVSNVYGYAKKSDSDCGYRVLARENKNGVEYAVIMLGVQADVIDALDKSLHILDARMDNAEINIASAMSLATEAYLKADNMGPSNNTGDGFADILDKVDGVVSDVEDIKNQIGNVAISASQAKAIAESAVVSAESIRGEAVEVANSALDKAGEIEKTVEPIKNWEYTDPVTGAVNTGATYFAEYVENGLSTKADMETVSRLDEENKLLIEKNAENYRQMLSSVDKYSIGEYSQAYGLTVQQARNILKDGMVYIPTQHADSYTHVEEYAYDDEKTLKREFTRGFYYVWSKLDDGEFMWSESIGRVWFSKEAPAGNAYTYWYNGDTLFLLYNEQWQEVALLSGNVNNRITSMIRQTAEEINAEVVNARGSIASLGARISNTESEVQTLALWSKDGDGKQYNLASIKQTAEDAGASVSLVVAEKDGEKVINEASIIAAINEGDSTIGINADRIVMTGTTTFLQPGDLGENGTTTIHGGRIDSDTLYVNAANVNGKLTADQIDASKLEVDAANVKGILAVGQLPDSVAEIEDIPTEAEITTITNNTISTTNVTAENLKVKAANVEGVLTIGQLPDSIAELEDIPTDSEITTITNNTIRTTNVIAENLKVKAANVEGVLTVGQLPSDVAQKGDIPDSTSDLTNDSGFQTASEVTIITNNTISTTNVTAENLKVKAANVEGVLTVGQLPDSIAELEDIPTESEITTITNNTISTTNVTAENLKVNAANVSGVLTIGQLPESVAEMEDIPTDEDITVITSNTIKTTNVTAENLTVKAANVDGKITADQIDATQLKVDVANITGTMYASDIIVSGDRTVADAIDSTLVSSDVYYALSTSTKTPPADDSWSREAPEKERKKYMWQKTVNVYGDGSSEEKIVCIAGATGDGPIVVNIKCSTGTIYINNNITNVTLTASVSQDNQDITDEFEDGDFLWEKYDMNGNLDTTWSYTGKTIPISHLDVYKRAVFNCILKIDETD